MLRLRHKLKSGEPWFCPHIFQLYKINSRSPYSPISRIECWIYLLILVIILPPSNCISFIKGMNLPLEQFSKCNIRITTHFQNTSFDDIISVPVTLTDVRNRNNLGAVHNYLRIKIPEFSSITTKDIPGSDYWFKYREEKCGLDLIILLGPEGYNPETYFHWEYQVLDYMADKYLVIVRNQAQFLSEDQTNCKIKYPSNLAYHKIFVWTVYEPVRDHQAPVSFHGIYFVSNIFYHERHGCPIFPLQKSLEISKMRHLMDAFAFKMLKILFSGPREGVNYRKLSRLIKLPYDEKNLYRKPSTNFEKFIQDLISRSNFSQNSRVQITNMGAHPRYQVADETDSFNFVTCLTSDTVWSIAKLFQRPYQPLVWLFLGLTLYGSGLFLFFVRYIGKNEFSVLKLVSCILFNLIEIGVSPGNVQKMKQALKLVFALWLLMSVVLTNSYKGLIIAYLSVPWAPEGDYQYFTQLKDFELFAPLSPNKEQDYWMLCAKSCPEFTLHTPIGYYVFLFNLVGYASNTTFTTQIEMFKNLRVVPRNDSKSLYQRMKSGEKIALVGLNTEIDEWLPELETEFNRISLFRGREQLWVHTKIWKFYKELHYKNNQRQIELIRLISSGIYQFWKYWLRDRKYIELKLKHDLNDVVEALSLSSCVTFVYVVLVFGLLGATTGFFVEIIHSAAKNSPIRQTNQMPWYKRHFF